ncbi:MAG: gamma-glutamyl-gamma-aminobutyrate hydrolase family protein [Cyanobacteria bacterium P01_F01_bin.150]
MPPTVLVIQNTPLDPAGVLGDELINCGAQLVTWQPSQQPLPPTAAAAGLVIMGGPMGAYDDAQFPHLQQTVDLIKQFNQADKPVLGVCLGAQLVARAFGSRVYPHSTPEIGFTPVTVADVTAQEPWLTNCSADLQMMQWHFDTFELPAPATLLMANETCRHQAFRIGSKIYGFQFHLEVTAEIIAGWQAMESAWIQANYPDLGPQFQRQIQAYGAQSAMFARQVARAWFALLSTPAALSA